MKIFLRERQVSDILLGEALSYLFPLLKGHAFLKGAVNLDL